MFEDGDLVDFCPPRRRPPSPLVRGRYVGGSVDADYYCEVRITKVFTKVGGYTAGERFYPALSCLRLVPPLEQLAEVADDV